MQTGIKFNNTNKFIDVKHRKAYTLPDRSNGAVGDVCL